MTRRHIAVSSSVVATLWLSIHLKNNDFQIFFTVIAAARALAVLRGRDYVLPADVEAVVRDAFRHRLVLSYQALAEEVTADQVLDHVLAAFAAPQIDLGRQQSAAA